MNIDRAELIGPILTLDTNKRATVTYCEGDLIIVICPDDESFGKEIDHATEFYARH